MTILLLPMDGIKADRKERIAISKHPAEIGRMKKILTLPFDKTSDWRKDVSNIGAST